MANYGKGEPNRWDKDPDSIWEYGVDWANIIPTGDSIATSVWLYAENGIVPLTSSFSGTVCIVRITGGDPGKEGRLTNRMTTTNGLSDDRTLYWDIAPR